MKNRFILLAGLFASSIQAPAAFTPPTEGDSQFVVTDQTGDLVSPSNFFTENASAIGAQAPVQSVAGKSGTVTLSAADVGLGNVDNTADADKPISDATQAALDALELPSHSYTHTAWVDPINGSDVTGASGELAYPYATIEEAYADLLAAHPSPSETAPITIKTLGGQVINLATGLSSIDGLILDLRDGSVLQLATGQLLTLSSGGYCKVLGGELLAESSYAVLYADAKFEARDCIIEGTGLTSSRVVAVSGNSAASQLILNHCTVINAIWAANYVRIADCSIDGLKLYNDLDFEIWDTRIIGSNHLLYGSTYGAVYFVDQGVDRTMRGLFRNCYFYASGSSRYAIVHSLSASNTVEVSLQDCHAFASTSIILKQSTSTMRVEGNVLYGNLASVGDGVLAGLSYDGDTDRTW